MSKLPNYCIVDNKDAWDYPMILDTRSLVIGYTYMVDYRDADAIAERLDSLANEREPMAKVPGHTIFITPYLNLSGRGYTAGEMAGILRGIADFYASYKIAKHPNQYARFRDGYVPELNDEWRPLTPEQWAAKKAARKAKRDEKGSDSL